MDDEIVLSRDQVREIDRRAIEDYGIPGIVLMENASRAVAQAALRQLSQLRDPQVAIVAGTGNNAGDGFAVARHLHNAGIKLTVLLAGDPARISGDAKTNLDVIRRMNLNLHVLNRDAQGLTELRTQLQRADLIIDAILGTGLTGQVRGFYAQVIEAINSSNKSVLAVDIPSGLDCDTGQALGQAVRALTTVTFVARKKGFDAPAAKPYIGKVLVADIGAPLV